MAETDQLSRLSQPRRLRWSVGLNWFSLVGLLALFTWSNLNEDQGSWLRWTVQCVPLLIFIPGLLRNSHRSYSWLCFVALIYMIPAITQAVMLIGYRNAERPAGGWIDVIFLLLTLLLFFAATMSSRWLQQWRLQTDTRT